MNLRFRARGIFRPAGLALAAAVWLASGPVGAQVPQTLGFQGLLTDANGFPLPDQAHPLTVTVYDAPSGGNALWSEALSVATTNGVFSVTLGEITPLTLPFDQPYWIGLTPASGSEMAPRSPLTAAPYALTARTVPDSSLAGAKIASGAVVRSVNGVTEDVTLQGSGGVSVSQVGNTLLINGSTGGGGDSDWFVSGNDMYSIPSGNVGIGTATPAADLHVYDPGSSASLTLEPGGPAGTFNFSQIALDHPDGTQTVLFRQTTSTTDLTGLSGEDLQITARAQLRLNGDDDIVLQTNDGSGDVTHARLLADGSFEMVTPAGQPTVILDAREGTSATQGGQITVTNDTGTPTLELDGDFGSQDSGNLRVFSSVGQYTVELVGEESGGTGAQGGQINVLNDTGLATVEIDGDFSETDGGNIRVLNSAGAVAVELTAEDAGGLGRIVADVVEIQGGADLSESFDVAGGADPGTVVSIDPDRPGSLIPSAVAYDRRVAGVVSGAGGVRPGMLMGQAGSVAHGDHPVALTGRVYVRADASYGAIRAGDLLTTSPTPGHAMRASEFDRAPGAILGKAMSTLSEGQGLVLVLVALQ